MAVVPLVDIVEGRALLDLSHRAKAADWTYPDEELARPVWPIQRLADQPVTIRPAHVGERPVRVPISVGALDPMDVVSALDHELRDSIEALATATEDGREPARDRLRAELHRHLDLLERVVFPLLDRMRADGADIARYPDGHARRAHALLGSPNPGHDDTAALDHARTAVDEVETRIVPLLRQGLDDRHRRLVASALALEAGLLGLEDAAPSRSAAPSAR